MRLLGVELRRFRSRRTIAVVLLLAVVAAALLAGSAIWSSRGANAAEVTEAQRQLTAERAATKGDLRDCLKDPPPQPADVPAQERCEELDPQLDWFLPREPLDLADEMRGSGLALALILTGAAIVMATTFAGTDWQSGALSTQLLFRPRRAALWTAKALAVVLGVFVSAVLVTAGFWVSLVVAAESRGLDAGQDLVVDVALHGARSVTLAVAAGLGAYALTMALRSTLATLALLFAYTVAGEALWASLPVERSGQWSLSANVQAWVLDGFRITDPDSCEGAAGACDPTYVLSAAHGAAYLGVLLAVALLVSLVTFLRRDVP